MKKIRIAPRANYQAKIEELGFNYNAQYWMENYYYEFTESEVDAIHRAAEICHSHYIDATEYVFQHPELLEKFCIPEHLREALIQSWEEDLPSIYGRFDFSMVNGTPKLLEYNADTPTSLFEASIVQWNWLQDVIPGGKQYNEIHEKLIASWNEVYDNYNEYSNRVDFCCIMDNIEDYTNTAYMASTVADSGLDTSMFDVSDMQFDDNTQYHCTPGKQKSEILFKLYPWEWLMNEGGSETLIETNTLFVEPLWKALWSNKYMLVILSQLFPDSPYILRAGETPIDDRNYCRKPIFSREGANVSLVKDDTIVLESEGEYGEEGYIYQELAELPEIDGSYPVIGAWIIGGEGAGMGVRDSNNLITDNMSNFVPHVVK